MPVKSGFFEHFHPSTSLLSKGLKSVGNAKVGMHAINRVMIPDLIVVGKDVVQFKITGQYF